MLAVDVKKRAEISVLGDRWAPSCAAMAKSRPAKRPLASK